MADHHRDATSYTNHTLLPEALETWPVESVRTPVAAPSARSSTASTSRIWRWPKRGCPGDVDFKASVSLIDERSGRRVRMGQLAFVGSHRINGVSAMHSDLMKETVFHDLNHLYPGRITNKTNGITFRRWLMLANPKLTDLLREACGEAVLDDPSQLELLEARASDSAFQQQFRAVKLHNKVALARLIGERNNIKVDPAPCSTSRSSASTNTSGNCSTSLKPWRCITRSRTSRSATGCRA